VKRMTYRHHSDRVRLLLMAMGVPHWKAKTHVLRAAAASLAKLSGVTELEKKDHVMWSVPIGGGPYENAISNDPVVKVLSGRRPTRRTTAFGPSLLAAGPTKMPSSTAPWSRCCPVAAREEGPRQLVRPYWRQALRKRHPQRPRGQGAVRSPPRRRSRTQHPPIGGTCAGGTTKDLSPVAAGEGEGAERAGSSKLRRARRSAERPD